MKLSGADPYFRHVLFAPCEGGAASFSPPLRRGAAFFSPPCEGGVRGGGPGGMLAWYAVAGRPDPGETPPRPKVLVMPCPPPLTPPSQGGEKDGPA